MNFACVSLSVFCHSVLSNQQRPISPEANIYYDIYVVLTFRTIMTEFYRQNYTIRTFHWVNNKMLVSKCAVFTVTSETSLSFFHSLYLSLCFPPASFLRRDTDSIKINCMLICAVQKTNRPVLLSRFS